MSETGQHPAAPELAAVAGTTAPGASPDARRRAARRRAATVAALAGVLAAGCFDPPVDEAVHLELRPGGGAEIRATVAIEPDAGEDNRAVAQRVADLRRALAAGLDDWTPRFEALEAREEEMRWRLVEGELTLFERRAVVDDADGIARFFADDGIGVFYREVDGLAELTLYPGAAGRATRRQRRRVERALGEWSERISDYLAAARALWEVLDLYPDRAPAAMAELFADLLPEGAAEAYGPLGDEEAERVERLAEAMTEAWEVLLIDSEEAYSLDELSRRVYDPFPAPVTVSTPAPVAEHEGFEPVGDERWAIRPLGLWPALERLEGRYLAPDPLLTWVRHGRADAEVDVEAFAARPRRAEPLVTAAELEAALAEGLAPAPVYRLAWPARPAG